MKRIGAVLFLVGLAVGGPVGWAQGVAGSRAQVYSVSAEGFAVPQVKLPNVAVARRINRALLRLVMRSAEGVDSLGTARQQIRQANRTCCYD